MGVRPVSFRPGQGRSPVLRPPLEAKACPLLSALFPCSVFPGFGLYNEPVVAEGKACRWWVVRHVS